MSIKLTIDGQELEAEINETILQVADRAGIYIPRLCYRPGLPPSHDMKPAESGVYREGKQITADNNEPFHGCQLCIVQLQGHNEFMTSCDTIVIDGMVVNTNTNELQAKRKEHLIKILKDHPHVCLTCAQKEGCSRTQCSANVPDDQKCCIQLGNCEVEKVADYIGISPETPQYVPQGLSCDESEPLFVRDYNFCIGCLRCVRACTEISGADVLGFVNQNSKMFVGPKRASSFPDADCRYCGLCVEVCPTGAMLDKNPQAGERESWLVPCRNTCPARIDVPRYIQYIAQGKPADAVAVIREKVPFPGVLGRVCFHPCEEVCRRNEINDAMAIRSLKRFAADNDTGVWKEKADENTNKYPKTGKKVGIIGGGPAGLTNAYYLSRKGHEVTIYESEGILGGMLAWGIPNYRLPESVLKQEIQEILSTGINVKTNTKVGKDITFDEVKNNNDAVFIAIGATESRRIDLEGSDLDNVYWGMDFLKAVNLGNEVKIGKNIIVIGGGNVAVDVAMAARREGAEKVQLVCLEKRDEMPAFDWELKEAVEEQVDIKPSWGPKRIIGTDGKVDGIELKHCISVFDENGKFAPKYNEDETISIDADTIILAIGQATDFSLLSNQTGIEIAGGCLKISEDTFEISTGIYAGGDAVMQPGSVIVAIANGRCAATSIDKYLGGDGEIDEQLLSEQSKLESPAKVEKIAQRHRIEESKLDINQRLCYDELCLGFDGGAAVTEAQRCLCCNLRFELPEVILPPEDVLAFTAENVQAISENLEGVFQLFDSEKNILVIKGTQDIKAGLFEFLESAEKSKFFTYEEDKMYSKRESELIQVYLQKHGQMPPGDGTGGADDMDDLF
jgi:NADPH-dependent glutamate synthase beta subunit-like oxidoreductase/Pyruvate/2-oxoacid:ferredoxin oxidoreductase delta subunit